MKHPSQIEIADPRDVDRNHSPPAGKISGEAGQLLRCLEPQGPGGSALEADPPFHPKPLYCQSG